MRLIQIGGIAMFIIGVFLITMYTGNRRIHPVTTNKIFPAAGTAMIIGAIVIMRRK